MYLHNYISMSHVACIREMINVTALIRMNVVRGIFHRISHVIRSFGYYQFGFRGKDSLEYAAGQKMRTRFGPSSRSLEKTTGLSSWTRPYRTRGILDE